MNDRTNEIDFQVLEREHGFTDESKMTLRSIPSYASSHTPYLCMLIVMLAVMVIGLAACQPRPETQKPSPRQSPAATTPIPGMDIVLPPNPGPARNEITQEPTVRVRIVNGANQAVIESDTPLRIEPAGYRLADGTQPLIMTPPVRVRDNAEGFLLTDEQGQRIQWQVRALQIQADTSNHATLKVGEARYPGYLVIHRRMDEQGKPTGRVDVVNHVKLETYLPGVLAKELYHSWHLDAFKAQAVAARSYAMYEQKLRQRSHFDLESTTASQVYAGQTTLQKAVDAVNQTRGQVMVYDGHVLPCFYSADAGLLGQDATGAFPGFPDLKPLRGQRHEQWGRATRNATWGPVKRSRDDSAKRIAAWGKANKHPVQAMQGLRYWQVSATSSTGRPTQYILTDQQGQQFILLAERLRFALNHPAEGLPTLTPEQNIRSSDMETEWFATEIVMRGRGFGHGVGLSQWTAQAMAEQNWPYTRILSYYYPGSEQVRVYE